MHVQRILLFKRDHLKNTLYEWIIRHQQVVSSSIQNNCVKVNVDGHSEKLIQMCSVITT